MIQSYDINIQTAKHGEWSEVYKNEYEAVSTYLEVSSLGTKHISIEWLACLVHWGLTPAPCMVAKWTTLQQHTRVNTSPRSTTQATSALLLGEFYIKLHTMFCEMTVRLN